MQQWAANHGTYVKIMKRQIYFYVKNYYMHQLKFASTTILRRRIQASGGKVAGFSSNNTSTPSVLKYMIFRISYLVQK